MKPERIELSQNSWLTVPILAYAATLLIRHSKAIPDGEDSKRTLSAEGRILCAEVSSFYSSLMVKLAEIFGQPTFHSSLNIRTGLTIWEILHPKEINPEHLLTYSARIKDLQGGVWYGSRSEMTEREILREFLVDNEVNTDPNFGADAANVREFVQRIENEKFKIASTHEYSTSLAAKKFLADEEMGLNECDGIIFFTNGAGTIISAEKIVPTRIFQYAPMKG